MASRHGIYTSAHVYVDFNKVESYNDLNFLKGLVTYSGAIIVPLDMQAINVSMVT